MKKEIIRHSLLDNQMCFFDLIIMGQIIGTEKIELRVFSLNSSSKSTSVDLTIPSLFTFVYSC